MRPKKRDKIIQEEIKPPFEQIQADHELFLQAFEKPTQIYRYLRSRNLVSPIFLHRTLGYMKSRQTRKHCTRTDFKVDSILAKVEVKHNREQQTESYNTDYMNLIFTSFFDKENEETEAVDVETLLMKICHKKRKDVSSPVMQESVGKVAVPCNSNRTSPPKSEAIAIGSNRFNHSNGHAVRSYVLLIRVTCNRRIPVISQEHSMCNGDIAETEEPPIKKRRTRSSSEGDPSPVVEEPEYTEETITYGAELIVYDKHKRCQLTDGDYELALHEVMDTQKHPTWETVFDGKAVGPFEVFKKCPTLKFKLSWSQSPLQGTVESPVPIPSAEEFIVNNHFTDHRNHVADRHVVAKDTLLDRRCKENNISPKKRKRIFYQFLYNNNTRQQTEARDDLHCPWCSLNSMQLFSLLKHLRLCHARFNFTYTEHPKGARIDVSINECYDGSYVGNPQDLHSHIGFAFCRTGPVRRTPVTHLIACRPKKPSFDLAEFMEHESETTNRQLVQGHNRLYYHTVTVQPIRPAEIRIDSEAENDPEWLRQKTINFIDEFTDVNEGEKEVMKMWN